MKVGKSSSVSHKSGSSTKATTTENSYKISFTEILAHKEHHKQKDNLEQALEEIDRIGDKLVENRTVEVLFEYKEMIKGFIEEVVDKGYGISERRTRSKTGRTKALKMITEIDGKLIELTNLILKREQKEINILNKVGEIKGLLVDLSL